jgi:hypothetical protein
MTTPSPSATPGQLCASELNTTCPSGNEQTDRVRCRDGRRLLLFRSCDVATSYIRISYIVRIVDTDVLITYLYIYILNKYKYPGL